MSATGPWVETILWEVPLMACLSEMYFLTTDTDWNYDGQEGFAFFVAIYDLILIPSARSFTELAYDKATQLLRAGIHFSEFGTRRRRSYHIQDLVVGVLLRAERDLTSETKGKVVGTSNVSTALHSFD